MRKIGLLTIVAGLALSGRAKADLCEAHQNRKIIDAVEFKDMRAQLGVEMK